MPATMEELGIDKWSIEDRRTLLHELYASIDRDDVPEGAVQFDDWEIQMINERLGPDDALPEVTYTWEEVKKQVWKDA
ncbi:hypothetical protein BH11PLA2_BH11PLA2_51240 [soil metagenome]